MAWKKWPMKYVCMVRSAFLPEFNINAKSVYFNPRFFPTTGSMIYWQVKDDGFHIQPNWRMLRSSDQGRLGRSLTMTGSCAWIEVGSGPERPQGRVFCLPQLFPVTLTVKLILKGWGGLIWCAVHQHRNIEFHHSHIWAIQHIDGYSSIWEEYKLWIPN